MTHFPVASDFFLCLTHTGTAKQCRLVIRSLEQFPASQKVDHTFSTSVRTGAAEGRKARERDDEVIKRDEGEEWRRKKTGSGRKCKRKEQTLPKHLRSLRLPSNVKLRPSVKPHWVCVAPEPPLGGAVASCFQPQY